MNWWLLLLLIGLSLAFIIAEIIFVPGTTVVGLVGAGVGIWAIVLGYQQLGTPGGHWLLGGYLALGTGTVVLALRSRAWLRFGLQNRLDSGTGFVGSPLPEVGQTGVAVSALRPMGTAEINGHRYEVTSPETFLASGTPLVVISATHRQITVRPNQ